MTTPIARPHFVYVTYISTTPEALWQALTDPDFTQRYWFGFRVDARGGKDGRMTAINPDGVQVHDDPILESDPPRRLVYGWKSLYDEFRDEAPSRVSFDLEPRGEQVKLTVTHEDFVPGSKMFPRISEGWPAVLSSLKSLLETGKPLTPATKATCKDAAQEPNKAAEAA